MKKKLLSAVLVAAMALGITACGKEAAPATPAATTKPASVPATKPASSTTTKVPTVVPAGVVLDWKNVTYNGISLKAVYNGKYYYDCGPVTFYTLEPLETCSDKDK